MAERNKLASIPGQPLPERKGNFLSDLWDEASGAFARYGRRSGAQRDASLALMSQAADPNTDPLAGAGMKALGLAGLVTHPLAFFPTREEWDQRLQAAGNDSRIGRSIGGFLSDLPNLIDPQMAAGGAVFATAPLAAKALNKADDVASLKAWRPPEIRDVTDKWDTDVYHATGNIFDEFRPSYRGSSFFGATPEAAKKGAQAGWGDGTGSGSLHTVHARVPSEEISGLAFTPKERKWFNALPDVASEAEVDDLMKKAPSNKIPAWFTVFDEVQNADGTFSYVKKKDAWRKSYSEAKADGRNVYGELVPHWGPQSDESKSAKWALDDGMSGYLVQDEAGLTVAMSDPNRIWMRSHSGVK